MTIDGGFNNYFFHLHEGINEKNSKVRQENKKTALFALKHLTQAQRKNLLAILNGSLAQDSPEANEIVQVMKNPDKIIRKRKWYVSIARGWKNLFKGRISSSNLFKAVKEKDFELPPQNPAGGLRSSNQDGSEPVFSFKTINSPGATSSVRKSLPASILIPDLKEEHKAILGTFLNREYKSDEHARYSPVVMDIASNFGMPLPEPVKSYLKELVRRDVIWGFGFNKTQVFCYWSPKSEEVLNASGLIGTGEFFYKDGDQVAQRETLNGKIISTVNAPETKQADQALFELGRRYQYADGVEGDLQKAVEHYQLAADKGNAKAQVALGSCYKDGLGVEQDLKTAVKYYQLAADKGNAKGQCALGSCYKDGLGVEKDAETAVKYYQLAADQGNEAANLYLRMMKGSRVKLQKEQAAKNSDLINSKRQEIINSITIPNLTEDHKKTITTFLTSGFHSPEHDRNSPVVMDIASNFGEPLPESVKAFLKELVKRDMIWGFGFNKTQVFCFWSRKSDSAVNASGLIGTGEFYYKDGSSFIQKNTVKGEKIIFW